MTTTVEPAASIEEIVAPVPGWNRPQWAHTGYLDGTEYVHARGAQGSPAFPVTLVREDCMTIDPDTLEVVVSVGVPLIILHDSQHATIAEATALHAALGDLLDQLDGAR